jgi:hypothetical protein
MDDPKPSIAEIVIDVGKVLSEVLCDHQAFFLLVLDDHSGVMPAVENVLARPLAERKRAADVLRMWAARIEQGKAPEATKA